MQNFFIRLWITSLMMWAPFAQADVIVNSQTEGRKSAPTPVFCTDTFGNPIGCGGAGGTLTNQPSTLTLTSATTAFAAGQFIANNSNGTLISPPTFNIAISGGTAYINAMVLRSTDPLATAWAGQTILVYVANGPLTFDASHGDRASFFPLTGTANIAGTLTCVMGALYGDGTVSATCVPSGGIPINVHPVSGTTAYWYPVAQSGSGVMTASQSLTGTFWVQN